MQDKSLMMFMNGIGNFIFFTSAIKILKKWGYDHLDLFTHRKFINCPARMELAQPLFDDIFYTIPDLDQYTHVFCCGWSKPMDVAKLPIYGGWMEDRILKTVDFNRNGMHEVQIYLNMIGASWEDFEGYLVLTADDPVLSGDRIRIALANPDPNRSDQTNHKAWDKFPELSQVLEVMGYEVCLLGAEDELIGCEGTDFRGKLSLAQSAKVLSQCDLLIAPSTMLALLADSVGIPILQIEGPILGSKTHPLISPYEVVRSYISCAPCFQKKLMRFCSNNVCMTSIEVGDVVHKALQLLENPKRRVQTIEYEPIKSANLIDDVECDARVAYLFPCFNRYYILQECLESFKESNPLPGSLLFLNDASTDPRVAEYLNNYEPPEGIDKYIFWTDPQEKMKLLAQYYKTPSTHAYNRLIKEVLALDNLQFDYVSICDPDAIFKRNWIQQIIQVYKEADKEHQIGLMSGFNYDQHPIYDNDSLSKQIFSSPAGEYRLRIGANLHYMMTMSFLKDIHGFYELETRKPSADISQNRRLAKQGYRAVVPVPSVMQQIGAFGSSFSRFKSDEVVFDF